MAAYRNPSKTEGKKQLQEVITSLRRAVPQQLSELISLGRTFKRRAADILAYFDKPGTSNGPTEAIECRHRHKPSTADSNTYVEPNWASGTSLTTSPDHCSTPEDSDHNYTFICDEPVSWRWPAGLR